MNSCSSVVNFGGALNFTFGEKRDIKCVRPRQDKIKRHSREIRFGVRMFDVKGTIKSCSCWACSDRHSTCAFINEALCAYLSRPSASNVTCCRTTPFHRLWGVISALVLFNKSWQHTAVEKQNKSTPASARPKIAWKAIIYNIYVCIRFLVS